MDLGYFIKGLVIGFSIAAPVGVIGVLCIRRTLADGQIYGFISGLGAATADAFYGSIAGFGLSAVSSLLLNYQLIVQSLGGVFLVYLGIRTFLTKPKPLGVGGNNNPRGLLWAYLTTVLLTITNPLTILSFIAIFAGLGLVSGGGSFTSAIQIILGVFIGSATWWLFLSGFVSIFRRRVNSQAMAWTNRFSGIIILCFGLVSILSLR